MLPGDVLGSILAMLQTNVHHDCLSLMGVPSVDGNDGNNRGKAKATST